MRPTVTDAARSVTLVSPAKTAEPIEMPLALWARMGPRNYVLDGVQIPVGSSNFNLGKKWPDVKYSDTAVICVKMAEPIDLPVEL